MLTRIRRLTAEIPARALASALGLLAILGLIACSGTLFGEADTLGQRLWQSAGSYVYVALPAQAYTVAPAAQEGIVESLCVVDEAAYSAVSIAEQAFGSGGDATAEVTDAAARIGEFSFDVLGSVDISTDPAEIAGRTLVLGAVAARTIPAMRAWRTGVMKPSLEAMQAAGGDPTPEQWDRVDKEAKRLHEAIQAACDGGPAGASG